MKCDKCKKEFWLMLDGETPEEMVKRYQDNPEQYCKEHRVPNSRIQTKEDLIKHWAFSEDEDAIYAETEGAYTQYTDYSGTSLDRIPGDDY